MAAAFVLVLVASLPARAVVGGTPISADDRRYDAVGLLITDTPWAPCGGWVSGTCTLVAPNLVLMARHSVEDAQRRLPTTGARTHKVRFRRGLDDSVNGHYGAGRDADCEGGFQEIHIQRFFGSPGASLDMVIGLLERVPVGISPLPVQVSHTFVAGEPIVLAGWGFDGPCLNTGDAWTLRMKSGVLPNFTYSNWCCFDYNQASFTGLNCFVTPPGSNWVIGNLHDSGAPLLSPDPANPGRHRVVGMVTGVTSALKIAAWNEVGGHPSLADTVGGSCLPDLDGDEVISLLDLFRFVDLYLVGDPRSDIDGVSGLSVNDLFTFLNRFFHGC